MIINCCVWWLKANHAVSKHLAGNLNVDILKKLQVTPFCKTLQWITFISAPYLLVLRILLFYFIVSISYEFLKRSCSLFQSGCIFFSPEKEIIFSVDGWSSHAHSHVPSMLHWERKSHFSVDGWSSHGLISRVLSRMLLKQPFLPWLYLTLYNINSVYIYSNERAKESLPCVQIYIRCLWHLFKVTYDYNWYTEFVLFLGDITTKSTYFSIYYYIIIIYLITGFNSL